MAKELFLLPINLYQITSSEIKKIRDDNKNTRYSLIGRMLPEYSINKDFGNIVEFDYFHQFAFEGEELHIGLDILPTHGLLESEMENNSNDLDSLFENQDFRPLFKELIDKNYSIRYSNNEMYPPIINLIVEIEYTDYNSFGSYSDFAEEFETSIKVLGYLDKNLDKVFIDVIKKLGYEN